MAKKTSKKKTAVRKRKTGAKKAPAKRTGVKKTATKKRNVKKRSSKTSRKIKKKTDRKTGKKAVVKSSRFKVFAKFALLAVGLFVGIMLPWTIYLDYRVTSEFEGRRWDLPSRVYARPLSLYPGMPLSREVLELELKAAGYQRHDRADLPGRYAVNGRRYEIYRRSFHFEDGEQPAAQIRLGLSRSQLDTLSSQGENLSLFRLDPAEIASIYPLHQEDRSLVNIEQVPELLVTGLQAVEDRKFKHHIGVDLKGIARAAWANVKAGKAVQGGSTLTQQLVKNYFLTNERSFVRKGNEAIMAILLELHYEKQEILEAYLNEIFLGQQGQHAIHGFGRASEFYFGQPLDRLETHQIALLIGMVKGASIYNPRRHPERARVRRNQVLDIFQETGLLTEKEATAAKARGLDVVDVLPSGQSRYPAFVDMVRRQLRQDYREEDLKSEGLRIFTTLSPSDQHYANRAVTGGLSDLASRGLPADLQAALVLADVGSGEIRALVGDRKPDRAGFNRALDARRQIGSVIKPLVYLLALEHSNDFNLMSLVEDTPMSLRQQDGSLWTPKNYDRQSHGEVTLLEALSRSYNQATVRLGMEIGVSHLQQKLRQLGIAHEMKALPSSFLGAVELTPVEVTQIYQSLAAGGYSVPLRAVTAVMTADNETLSQYPLRLLPLDRRDAIAVLNFALTQVVEQGTARALPGLLGSNAVIAGKTGTTNERRDSWFVGYTRDLVAVTWVGDDDFKPAGVTGSNAAMRLWARLFKQLPLNSVDLRMPDNAYWLWVDAETGTLSDQSCEGAIQIPFVEDSEDQTVSPCLAELQDDSKQSIWRKWFGKKQ